MRLNVIGLGHQRPPESFQEALTSGPFLARDGSEAARWLTGTGAEVTALDHIFENPDVPAIPDLLRSAVRETTGSGRTATYLVPGAGNVGDETVRLLGQEYELDITPGALTASAGLGGARVLDALELALAEVGYPFDAGATSFDHRVPAIITNVRGRAVVQLATQRLERLLGEAPPAATGGLIVLEGMTEPAESTSFDGLAQIVSILRSPDGCPWDREQTVESLLPLLSEEIDEFFEAWQNEEPSNQADELGDVLLHILMISQIAREAGRFTISDVLKHSSAKMLRRHPHVFGDVQADSMEDLHRIWNEVKAREKADKANQ